MIKRAFVIGMSVAILSVYGSGYFHARAEQEYKAEIKHVAGGSNLDEVQMFEDNYVRCYVIKEDSHCFEKR